MNKWNNRLVLVFFALILFGVYWLYRESKNREPMLVTELLGLNTDSTVFNQILIYPETVNREEIQIQKLEDEWYVMRNNKNYPADQTSVNEMLDALLQLKINKITSTDHNVWPRYGLDEINSSTIKLISNGNVLYQVHVGKFDMTTQSSKGRTYFRIEDRNEIFETSGFLAMNVNRGIDSWRDKTVLKSNSTLWKSLIFEYSADSSFSINRTDGGQWTIDDLNCDSLKVHNYLQSISGLSESNFVYELPEQTNMAIYQLSIEMDNAETVRLSAIPLEANEFILLTTKNPDSWFKSHKSGLIRKIFKGRSFFLPE